MAIQFTSVIGGVTKDVVRDTVVADPRVDEIVFLIGTTVETTQGYQKSRISESALELGNRFLNNTEYAFDAGLIAGLSRRLIDPNSIAIRVLDAASVPADEVAILIGADIVSVGSSIVNETIIQIVEAYLETDGVST